MTRKNTDRSTVVVYQNRAYNIKFINDYIHYILWTERPLGDGFPRLIADNRLVKQNRHNITIFKSSDGLGFAVCGGGSGVAIFSAEGAQNYTIVLPNPASTINKPYHELHWVPGGIILTGGP